MTTLLYVGVDWHKRNSTWVAINEQREKVYEKVWDCTPEATITPPSPISPAV